MIFVDDLVAAACRWLDCPGRGNRVYELHDGTAGGYSWNDLVAAVESMRGRSVVRLPISRLVLTALANINLIGARVFGSAPMLSPGKVNELRHPDWVCDNRVISMALGWHPSIVLSEGLRLTLGSPTAVRG
jgi:nucleoside-diphosphate-sugar epimerase